MNPDKEFRASASALVDAVDRLTGRTIMVVGATGTGKTKLARDLMAGLTEEGDSVALVSADMGQPSVGVPTCMGLAMQVSTDRPAGLWFVGDVTPRGNLLPTVVGTARLVQRAREEGAQTVVVDTTGFVEGSPGLALKYHKALAARVDCVVALQRSDELREMLELLEGICPVIYHLRPVPEAEDRSAAERKAYREARYREHFMGGEVRRIDHARLIGSNWAPAISLSPDDLPPGTVAGLLDQGGYCLGLGLIEEVQIDRLALFTACEVLDAVDRVQVGRLCLDRAAGFAEVR